MRKILVGDDQADVRQALRLLLKGEGWQVEMASAPEEVLRAVSKGEYDLLIMDLNYTRDTTSGREGLDLLAKLNELDPALPVIVMTAWGTLDLVVEVMKRGARDFCQKPWDNTRMLATVRTQLQLRDALKQGGRLEAENKLLREQGGMPLVAQSPAMKPVLELIERIGPSGANVLITGENGTGKGVVARALHSVSARNGKPFVTVNMGGLSEGVFESELFGHTKGAFTDAKSDRVGRFELAEGGTLFMDEIANMPLSQQAKLLRVLETGEFERVGSSQTRKADVRILSATNSDPQSEVASGRFRQDLLFRLNTVTIHIPALRDRPEDISVLGKHFLEELLRRYRKNVTGFDESALSAMRAYGWPGNVRELSHVVERAILMCTGPLVCAADLGLRQKNSSVPSIENMSLEEVEQFLIRKTLSRFNGNVLSAAEALGLSRSAFYRRLEKYRL